MSWAPHAPHHHHHHAPPYEAMEIPAPMTSMLTRRGTVKCSVPKAQPTANTAIGMDACGGERAAGGWREGGGQCRAAGGGCEQAVGTHAPGAKARLNNRESRDSL